MDKAQTSSEKDPLIEALPPATDYITYLTLLEYQLNTKNLSTLNRLLAEDDGTLAAEIGWDLLKLVLPMLQIVPDEANKCFEIIARRGNPREVIVRVSEELERLGHDDESGDEDDDDAVDGTPPTFANEAKGIHLGAMTLDGMPQQMSRSEQPVESGQQIEESLAGSPDARSGSDDVLSLTALMSMLGILHPRIKTEFPSRFLATSLPAALGAFRRLTVTEETASAFLSLLSKLAGKQRPVLPPRTSTAGSAASLAANDPTTASTAPLPDPEAKTDTPSSKGSPSDNDKAIIQRLLQAVTLEVLDEYTNALLVHDVTQMQWTSRLREELEPEKVVLGRSSTMQQWSTDVSLKERDALLMKFIRLGKDLGLKASEEVTKFSPPIQPSRQPAEETKDTEYPQTPSDIPFSVTGLVLLKAAQRFYQSPTVEQTALTTAFQLLEESDSWTTTHSPALIDAVLSLIYSSLKDRSAPSNSRSESVSVLNRLTELFTTNPDATIRDNAHHIATMIFHDQITFDSRLFYIKSLLQTDATPQASSPIRSIQAGNLKSIAVDWLKDEFLASTATSSEPQSSQADASIVTSDPHQEALIDPVVLLTDSKLVDLLFPQLPALPGPFISSHPPAAPAPTSMSSETDLETFLLHIPFYVSSINLVTVLCSFVSHEGHGQFQSQTVSEDTSSTSVHSSRRASVALSESDGTPILVGPLLSKVSTFVSTLSGWQHGLLALLSAKGGGGEDPADSPVNLGDVYALEDAVGRATAALKDIDDGHHA